jgi:hypothetical protein
LASIDQSVITTLQHWLPSQVLSLFLYRGVLGKKEAGNL